MKEDFPELVLPCLRGSVGDWVFYNTVIPFNQLNRIDTEHKIKEDKNLDRWLQRELKERVETIKEYLLKEDERFFNSIIVGLYGDSPDWYALDLSAIESKFNVKIGKNVESSLGVLSLSGREILFTIDGQHRIEAIKRAISQDIGRFESDELSVIFVGHKETEKGYVRTRKLFATINREAKQPSKNDLAIIDETYAHNIVARMVFAKYDNFKGLIALTENYDLDRNDHAHFTNLLNLVEVNKRIFRFLKYKESRYSSPSYEKREELYDSVISFYDFAIENISEYKDFFKGEKLLAEFRNAEAGKPLNLLFLPIGILLIADIYCHFLAKDELYHLKNNINKFDFELYTGDFKYIFFNPVQNRILASNRTIAKRLMLYRLGEDIKISDEEFKTSLAKVYNINNLSKEYIEFQLPDKFD